MVANELVDFLLHAHLAVETRRKKDRVRVRRRPRTG